MSFSWQKVYKKLSITVASTLTGDKPISKLCDADKEIRKNIDDFHDEYEILEAKLEALRKKVAELLSSTGGSCHMPRGGDTGQILIKQSNYDFEARWGDRIYNSLFDVSFSQAGYTVRAGYVVWRTSTEYKYCGTPQTDFTSTGYIYVLFNARTETAELLHSTTHPTLSDPEEDITIIAYVKADTTRVVYHHLGAVKYARD